ncbi:Ninein-like protein [Nibea albiflora]|nr:Ninein-like protein [Nibea albiflora]
MEEAEHSRYVTQLKAEFDSCDTTATGFLDRDELTALCQKLHLDAHLPLLLDTLLGERTYARALWPSCPASLDFSTSEDDSSYLEPGPQQEKVELDVVIGAGGGGVLCDHLGQQQVNTEVRLHPQPAGNRKLNLIWLQLSSFKQEVDELDGRGSIKQVLCGSAPISCSTPVRSADLQRAPHRSPAVLSTSPSLLTATVGQRVLSRLDDGSGCTSPERVIALWTEEGIRNSRDILQTLDFPLEERLSLADLTLALDNELLVSGSGIHQAALISYKNEIQHLLVVAEQACRERDKVKVDLDQADQRNLQLVREVDDRHASMETLNQSRLRDLEQDFRDRLTVLRSQSEQESEALLQQAERERGELRGELHLLRAQEAELQEELCSATQVCSLHSPVPPVTAGSPTLMCVCVCVQENRRLEDELSAMKLKLSEAESSVNRLQRDLDQLLHDKVRERNTRHFGTLDPAGAGLSHEERFSKIVKEYELQFRELRDRNDELSSELELLKSQRNDRKFRHSAGNDNTNEHALSWNEQRTDSAESDCALCSLDAVSIQTELALQHLEQKHKDELQQLNVQLETQVNYYERSLELMRQSMEVERKDISQAFKLEISELEEQKAQVEQEVKQLKETLSKLQTEVRHGGGGGWSNEQERRTQRERAELEQNFAREIGTWSRD